MNYHTIVSLLAATVSAHASDNTINPRPVIGVLAQECIYRDKTTGVIRPIYVQSGCPPGFGSIAASYIKWLEASGALVYLVSANTTNDEMTELLTNDLSGLVIPGGGSRDRKGFFRLAEHAIRLVLSGGASTPIFGICMGFEVMGNVFAGLTYNSDNFWTDLLIELSGLRHVALPSKFPVKKVGMKNVPVTGRLWSDMTKRLKNDLQTKNVTHNAHRYSFTSEDLYRLTAKTGHPVVVTGISENPDGTEFVASFEHQNLPLYGLQWHPEKTNFVFSRQILGRYDFSHTQEAIEVSQHVGNFLVKEARKHANRYRYEVLGEANLSYMHAPVVLESKYFLATYFV